MDCHNSFNDFPMFLFGFKNRNRTDSLSKRKNQLIFKNNFRVQRFFTEVTQIKLYDWKYFSFGFIFCVIICVLCRTLEKVLFLSFFSDFPMFFFGSRNRNRTNWSPLVISPVTFENATERNSRFLLRSNKVPR